jgi:Chitobiase/beta-hexosaminidase C-terminal domain/FG-GAP-like repeat/Bacterial Ig-like domain (group 3)
MFAVTHLYTRPTLGAFLLIVFLAIGSSSAHASIATTSTSLTITADASAATSVSSGTVVTLTAAVNAGSAAVTAGQVKFCDADAADCADIHLLGIAQLTTAGVAAFKFVPGPGIHSYKAEFLGTATAATSASDALSLTVNIAPTTTIAKSGANGNYTLKATVAGKGSTTGPGGEVSFLDTTNQNAVLGTAELGASTGSLTWTTPQSPATQPRPQSIVVADFNGDGIPDIAVGVNATTTGGKGYINVLLGNGDGTFQAAKTFAALSDNQAIVAAPFVDGGPIDILTVSNSSTGTNNALILTGDGKGGFTVGTPFSLGGVINVSALITGDFNGDGKQDFVVAGESFGVPVIDVFLGNGNGTFNSGTLNATADTTITALGAGDFTGSGALDLAVVGSDGSVQIFLQDGLGDFFPGASVNAGKSPSAIAVGDFNGDGKADLAVANSGDNNVTILLGTGNGNFTPNASPSTGVKPASIALGDFNGDGIVDLAVANSGANTVTVLLGKGNGTFNVEPALTTGSTPIALAAGNFDGEDVSDLAVANNAPASVATTGTATILLAELTQTATATATGVTVTNARTQLVDASYAGDDIHHASVSATISITGSESQAVAPVLSPAAGTYASAQSVKITDGTAGATIYYTTNGTTPTASSTKYTVAIAVAATETIKAIAVETGFTTSVVATAAYSIEKPAATPVFSPAAGTYTSAQSVKITDATAGATIYYTTNGTTPTTSSTKYTVAIAVAATETIKAIAVATGFTTSTVATAVYTIEKPAATPVFSPAAGTYPSAQSVKITDATAGATIYYTTNGTTPTTSSTKYTVTISVAATETIKAIAVATGFTTSAVATAKYTIASPAAKPTFSVASGTYSSAQSVKISDATPGATIYYTTNGATPTPASAVYKSAVDVSVTEYLQAIAVADGFTTSPLAEALYSIGPNITATPVLSPPPGAYSAAQTVTMTDATPGAVITYSVGIGSVVNTYTYSGPFTVSSTEYIAYDAIAPGYTRSPALEGIYTIGTVPAPEFSPIAGTYSTAQLVNIYDITPGATIHYTTNGTAPTTGSAVYSGPIVVAANETIRAIATTPKLTTSVTAAAAYSIGKVVATPTFSLAAGSYTSAQSTSITDITPGTTIYYTLNGTTPTTASTKYTKPIAIAATETIKAIAVASGYTNSAVGAAAYTIGFPIETFVVTPSGNNVLTIPVGGSSAFTVAAENQSGQSFASITVKTSTGSNPSLPVQVTICETNPSTGQCLAAPASTVTLSSFAPGANASFSVFVTATAAIASSPSNEVVVLFTNPSGTVLGSASVEVVTD